MSQRPSSKTKTFATTARMKQVVKLFGWVVHCPALLAFDELQGCPWQVLDQPITEKGNELRVKAISYYDAHFQGGKMMCTGGREGLSCD